MGLLDDTPELLDPHTLCPKRSPALSNMLEKQPEEMVLVQMLLLKIHPHIEALRLIILKWQKIKLSPPFLSLRLAQMMQLDWFLKICGWKCIIIIVMSSSSHNYSNQGCACRYFSKL